MRDFAYKGIVGKGVVRRKNIKRGVGTYNPMTICIASICRLDAGGPAAIVFCADRLLSGLIKFEHTEKKFKAICTRAVILEAGSANNSDLVINSSLTALLDKKKMEIRDVAKAVQEKINILIKEKFEKEVLSQWGLSYDEYIVKNKFLAESLLRLIEEARVQMLADINLEFIVAGLDPNGAPHLFVVSSERGISCLDSVGFIAIGSGGPLSLIDITKTAYGKDTGLAEALMKVHAAKKSAERDSAVGKETGIGVIFQLPKKEATEEEVAECLEESDIAFRTVEINPDLKDALKEGITKIEKSEERIRQSLRTKISTILYNPSPEVRGRAKK